MDKIGLLTSGGDAPGMNPAIRAVVRSALYSNLKVVGIKRGYNGLIEGDFEEMGRRSVADIVHRGGTMLRTARCEEFKTEAGMDRALKNIKKEGIDGIVVIGGDGSLRGVRDICEKMDIPAVGIPGTIDNDLPCTDLTLGCDTAMNTILESINKIRDTATSHERTFVVEAMGRDSGYLTLMAGLAGGAESILIPEIKFNIGDLCNKIQQGYERGKLHSIILVAEGVGHNFETNRDINESRAFAIAEAISERTSLETRVIILGHLQRGGSPSALDRILGSRMGAKAVELLIDGHANKMVNFINFDISYCDIDEVLSQKKEIDLDIYNLAHILSI